ncbi:MULTISPECIES: exodeoxyribonuclease V subunit gamma [Thiorhodovibrio]|uniref:exodeoxyribonuclease V subunit gamma n=1 Tax=Thiorhodovibrio TaxID=61593 RepID=UPI001912E257|nr:MULTISPECIES: exodeoxyribonuclease V subunit gamma [Thiorhodovibrio]MBK5968553.1 exodeoxyribonuclease V subunit gamma [Thiorhodovibrio winogradskyi]WPL11350.1 Exodeoxyribonuclease V gamma chain [Thiorhodovibrio litoralis]
MLRVYHSNRLERLLDALAARGSATALDPFEQEVIVVPNQGMARWVSQQLALRSGISANIEYPLPATFFWRVLKAWLPDAPEQEAYQHGALAWRIFRLLPGLISSPAFADLQRYLNAEKLEAERLGEDRLEAERPKPEKQGLEKPKSEKPVAETSDLRRFELASQLASLFDEYLIYRHDLCLKFEDGAGEDDWQAILWRAVAEGIGSAHRARLMAELAQAITAGAPAADALPRQVSFFGVGSLAPVQVQMLDALAKHREVALYYLNPCREYWADVEDESRLARRRARARRAGLPDPTGMLDIGNPLLASLGHAGQVFLDQLLELGGEDAEDFIEPDAATLLGCLQRDMLHLADRRALDAANRTELEADDLSFRVHGAHGPLREVQVLHDRLLDLIDTLPDLEPRDIIVMAPDIELYAPYVDAVFSTAEVPLRIPWTLADRKPGSGQSLAEAIKLLLALQYSRLTASEILTLMAVPALQRRFGITEPSRERLAQWISEAGIRWGLDQGNRCELGLPAERLNTWAFGLERLFLGYAMPPEWADTPYQGVLPYADIDPGEVDVLGALQSLIDALSEWRARLTRPRTAELWVAEMNALLEAFFDPAEDDEFALLDAVRASMEQILIAQRIAGVDERISIDLVGSLIKQSLDEPAGAQGFLTGRVTFTNMVPMRSIPHRVVAILGMDANAFPRSQRSLSFDRIASEPRRGDRSRRRDDRYLFLECLLAARDAVHISWTARGARDNSPRARSVVVDEVLDYIDAAFRIDGADKPRDRIVVHHPLQPFSQTHFDGSQPPVASHSTRWCEAARALVGGSVAPFIGDSLPAPDPSQRQVALSALLRFLRDPSGHFLRERLGLRLPRLEDAQSDEEPFSVGTGLARYAIRAELLGARATGHEEAAIVQRLRATGALPHGAFGEQDALEQLETVDALIARQQVFRGQPVEPVEIDLSIGDFRLQGELRDLTDAGLLLSRPAKIKPKDRLAAWVWHLALCAASPQGVALKTAYVAEDFTLVLEAVEEPVSALADLLELYWEGLTRPVPFFPDTSFAWFNKQTDEAVADSWDVNRYTQAEGSGLSVRMAFRGLDPLADPFKDYAMRVYGPIDAVAQQIKAGQES